jgi:hypothetical protein
MWKDSTFRASVIASVIASLLVIIFVQPLLNFVWGVILWLGMHVFIGMLNQLYANAALGHRDWVVAFFAMIALTLALMAPPTAFIVRLIRRRSIQNKRGEHPPAEKTSPWKRVVDIGMTVVGTVAISFMAASIYFDLQLNTSFDQRIAVLAPKVSDQTIKELRAQWALMESREDYLALEARLGQLAHDAGITLPKPLLK